jgi:NADPH:quinone reductase
MTIELERKVWPLLGESIYPVIDSTFALKDAADAHSRIKSTGHVGKGLLDCG